MGASLARVSSSHCIARGNAMKLARRKFLHLAAGATALPALPRIARAQAYPTRPIRLVIPFPPGGAFDFVGRPWADRMKPLVGVVVIENIGGGGSSLGAGRATRGRGPPCRLEPPACRHGRREMRSSDRPQARPVQRTLRCHTLPKLSLDANVHVGQKHKKAATIKFCAITIQGRKMPD